MFKKIILTLLLFFSFFSCSYAFSGSGFTSDFSDLDLTKFERQAEIVQIPYMSGATHYVDYTNFYIDTNKILYQIFVLQLIIGFFVILFVSYSIINDLLGKK